MVSPIPEFDLIVEGDPLKVHTTVDPFTGSSVTYREPIALQYIDSYVRKNGYASKVFTETEMEIDNILRNNPSMKPSVDKIKELKALELVNNLNDYRPDLVGISVHSAVVYPDTVTAAKNIKKSNKDMKIVLGGYHPTGEIIEYVKGNIEKTLLHSNDIDFVISGEGEETFLELANALTGNGNLEDIAGLAYKEGDEIVVNKRRMRCDFKSLPWPTRYKEILKYSRCAPLAYPAPSNQNAAAQISGSRGCVYGCDFCSSMTIWPSNEKQGKYPGEPVLCYRDVDDIVSEIKWLNEKFNVNYLTFTDLTLNVSKRYVSDLTGEMISEGVGHRPNGKNDIGWFAYTTVDKTVDSPDTIEMMADAGCSRIGIGVESLHSKILSEHKPNNTTKDEIRSLEIVNSQGILNRTYLIVGWPDETPEMFDETHDILISGELPVDQLRMAFIVPFMGTPLFGEYKDRLLTRDWTKFTGDVPVVQNDYMTPDEMKQKVKKSLTGFYRSDSYKKHIGEKIKEFPHLRSSFKYWEEYLQKREIIPSSYKLVI